MIKQILASTLFLFCLSASSAQAETILTPSSSNDTPRPLSGFEQYVKKFDQKFDRGGLNFTAGWTEVLRQPIIHYKSSEKKNRPLKAIKGFGIGLWNGVADTLGGFSNALTSFLPGWEIPLPQGGIAASNISGGNPESLQTDDEYRVTSPAKTPRAIYAS